MHKLWVVFWSIFRVSRLIWKHSSSAFINVPGSSEILIMEKLLSWITKTSPPQKEDRTLFKVSVIALYKPPIRICSNVDNIQYLQGRSSVSMRHICSSTLYKLYAGTHENMHYPWVISSVPVSHILSTHEDMQYLWGKFHSLFIHINLLMGTEDMTHGYWWYDSWVLHILMDTEDMTHGYWWYDSWVLMIWLTGTEDMTHRYWGYDSRVLRICLTSTEDMTHGIWKLVIFSCSRISFIIHSYKFTNGYCIPSRVLRIWLMGTDDMTHG